MLVQVRYYLYFTNFGSIFRFKLVCQKMPKNSIKNGVFEVLGFDQMDKISKVEYMILRKKYYTNYECNTILWL